MGLFMWYGYSQGKNIDLFSMTHMYYPAAGAMIALMIGGRDNKLLPKPFFICYLLQTVVMIGFSLMGLFTDSKALVQQATIIMLVGGLLLLICLGIAKKERRAAYGLSRKIGKQRLEWSCFISFYTLHECWSLFFLKVG